VLNPAEASANEIENWITDAGDHALGLAILCQARGWTSLAEKFFERRPKDSEIRLPGSNLRFEAWYYWQNELSKPRSHWPTIARHMGILIGTEPDLNSTDNKALMRSLQAALVSSKATAGSIEAQIDALVDVCSTDLSFFNNDPDPVYLRLVETGFGA